MSIGKKILTVSAYCILSLFFGLKDAQAQDMTEVQPLSFGRFALVDNSAPHQIVVEPDNSVTYDPSIVADTQAQRGVYTFSGLASNVIFYLGVNVPNPPAEGGVVLDNTQALAKVGGGEVFSVGSYKINTADELVTDGAGNATMNIGATLTTSGNGAIYGDGNYNGQYDITLFY